MPWRLIGCILLGVVFLGFIGFNLENRCDISFGFYTFSQVPVFLTAFSAFVLGLLLALPLAITIRRRSSRKDEGPKEISKGKKKTESDYLAPGGYGSHGID
ncbi:MAG: hypothetical protein LBT39_07480 [Treponema sp.]|jgi:uncharacterized integral membrane protein|nr:hypothetical protein [Treponema sp.]